MTVDDPDWVARMLAGETTPRETVKVLLLTVTPAAPFTSLNSVAAVAEVPLTVTTKGEGGIGLQATEIRPAVLTVAVQPAGRLALFVTA